MTSNGLPRRVEKPWGYEEIWAQTDAYVGKILHVKQGARLSYQYHRVKKESLRVLSGLVEMTVLQGGQLQTMVLSPGDVLYVPPTTRHRMKALEDAIVLEVSTPHLDDVVRVEDDYGRERG